MSPALFRTAACLGLLLPWLNPFATGPSAAVVPWLVCLAAASGLLFLAALPVSLSASPRLTFNQRWAPPAALAWGLAGLLSSAFGLLQYFGFSALFSPWVNETLLGEAFANLRQRNQFATLTNIALAALLWWALTWQRPVSRRLHLLFLLAAALLAAGNAASSSRTGLLQLALLMLLSGFIWSGWRAALPRNLLLTALLSYSLSFMFLPRLAGGDFFSLGLVARLSAVDAACSSRLTLWSNVLHLIAQKPWLGWGWGELSFAHHSTLYAGPRFCDILDNAHNLPLHLAVELGLPMALALCAGFGFWVWLQKPWRERDATRQLAWAVLALILLHSLLEYPLWYGPFQMAAGLCLVLLWRRKQPEKTSWLRQYSLGFVALFLALACLYAAWDYQRISQIYLTPEARSEAYREDTLRKINRSWLFAGQARFAGLNLTPLTLANAQSTFESAGALLHFSPEPRVIEKYIESALMLGLNDQAKAQMLRYRQAFPAEFALWLVRDSAQERLWQESFTR